MRKIISFILALVMLLALASCAATPTTTPDASGTTAGTTTTEPRTAAFVMIGLNNDFFQALKGAYEEGFKAAGWNTEFTSGEFNPQTQITAVENYIAAGVDVIFIWAVAPGPLDTVAQQAMDAGIKVIAFVQTLANYDAAMLSDDSRVAMDEVYLASRWVDEKYPDAAEGSIPAALITMDGTEVTKTQAQVIKDNLSTYNPKIKLVTVYDVDAESVEAGVTAAESIYTTNPEVKLFLTVNASPALGINNYFTGISSPVTEYADMGIFTINGGTELFDPIKASATDKAPLRGTVITAGIGATIADMLKLANGTMDGTYKDQYKQYAENLFINAETVEEYIASGTVTSIKEADFMK